LAFLTKEGTLLARDREDLDDGFSSPPKGCFFWLDIQKRGEFGERRVRKGRWPGKV